MLHMAFPEMAAVQIQVQSDKNICDRQQPNFSAPFASGAAFRQ